MTDLLTELRCIADALDLARVDYALCGGVALAIVWQSRQRVAWDHGTIGTVSRAGLVALKRLRGSGQDHDDIRRLTGETECR